MGVDIHVWVIDKNSGNILTDDLADGMRNSDWFANLQEPGYDHIIFSQLPRRYDKPDWLPQQILDDLNETGYYGYFYMKWTTFYQWWTKYRPDQMAGWVPRYDKWLYEQKGIIPGDTYRYPTSKMIPELDWLEYTDPYEPTTAILINETMKLMGQTVSTHLTEYYIVIYFDR